ncbi:MAG: HD domain-containing protein [Armatimonadetes bacterium]|nr:HD domain-containing protein [Armatimonadota bacterium]
MTADQRIAGATQGTKWENRLFLVGGAVRDPLFGLPSPPDVDIVLEGDALELARFLREANVSAIEPVTYPRFGTALVMVEGSNVELATARSESYDPESRKPEVRSATLKQDALRRDFTINTPMRNLHTGELVDLLGTGLDDLRKRVLRTPLDPAATFSDDPLRTLRAVRFKNRFDLTPAPGLWEAIRGERERLNIISKERIRDELSKMLLHRSAADSLRDLMDLGLLPLFAPELEEGIGVEQGSFHSKDVWEHTLDVVEIAAALEYPDDETRLRVVLGALLHDVAKPRTRSVEESGRVRFFEHERRGGEMTRRILKRLRFPGAVVDDVGALVANHMRLGSAVPFTPAAARRLVRDLEGLTEPLITLCEADAQAIGRTGDTGVDFADVREKVRRAGEVKERSKLESPLTGQDIMDLLGVPEGPEVGRWKTRLTEAVLEGEIQAGDKEAAASLLREEAKKQAHH